MDTISSLQKENKLETLNKHLEGLKHAKARFESQKGKSHTGDADKEKYQNKIDSLDEQIKTTEQKIKDVKK
jgi:hypothetical protein